MAHRIKAYAGREAAWHGLGKVLHRRMSIQEALREGGLDFTVEKRQLFFEEGGGFFPTDMCTTVRTDTGENFGRAVSCKYGVIQNSEAFSWVEGLLAEESEAVVETAGLLDYGGVGFMAITLPDYITVKGDKINTYLLITKGHDGLHSMICKFTPVRVVCHNTLTGALRGAGDRIVIRHTRNAATAMKNIANALEMKSECLVVLQEALNVLARKQVTEEVVVNTIRKGVFKLNAGEELGGRSLNAFESIMDYLHGNEQNRTARGSAYWLYNGINGWLNNVKGYASPSAKFASWLDDGTEAAVDAAVFSMLMKA